jgi:hypothetical protein
MAQEIEVDININNNTEATIKNLRALKRQLRETAAGSAEFDRISMAIREMDDAIKDASATSDDFLGYLENASGPLGVLGRGIRGAEKNFSSFNAILKASVIGLITIAIGGLVAAFSKSETAMKKLEPVFQAFEKILGGIMQVFDPLLDMFIELALRVLPYIAKGVGGFYSGLFALFSLIKNVGLGAGKILKGIFTLDFDALKEGYSQLTGSWNSAVEEFKEANKRFNSGSDTVTKTETKNSKERVKTYKKEVKEKEKVNDDYLYGYAQSLLEEYDRYQEHLKKIAELEKQYNTELEDIEANTEQKKLDLWYKRRKAEIDAILTNGNEKNRLYALLETQRANKQGEIDKKSKDDEDKNLKISRDNFKKLGDDIQKILDVKLQAQLQYASAVGNAIGSLSGFFEQGTAAAKTAALTEIAINTALGFVQGLDIAQKSAKATGPAAAFAFPIFYATQIGAVLSAANRARGILSAGKSSGAGGGISVSNPSVPQAPSFNVVGTGGANQIAQTIGAQGQTPVRAYVVSSDVTTQQALDRNIVKSASLG